MTNNDRGIRTLLVCFVLAVLALLPLRLVEIRGEKALDVQVLGETMKQSEVILPNAEIGEEDLLY